MLRTALPALLALLVACKDASTDDSGGNTAPSLSQVTLEPAEITEEDVVTCVPTGWFDPDGDAEQYRFRWLVNGDEAGTSATLRGDVFSKGDVVICEVTPTDGVSDGSPVSSAETPVLNAPPSVPTAVLDPDPPHRGAPARVAFPGAVDADGDTITATYRWYVNGVEVSTAEALTPDLFARGDSVYAVASVSDGEAEPQTLVTPTATVGNAPPVITAVTLSPSPARSSDTLIAELTAEDPDGDTFTLSYAWFINGQQVAEYSASLAGPQWLSRDDAVYVSVTGDDGIDTSDEALSETLVVLNAPPEPPSVEASPERPGEGLWPLVCEPTAGEDFDGDPVTLSVSWEVDGVPYNDATETNLPGDTVPAEDQIEGQDWVCYVVASDGIDDSEAGTWSVTIGEAYPELLLDGRSMTLGGGTRDYSTIRLINGATLTVSGDATLRAYSITVERGSWINVEGGYSGGSEDQDGGGAGGGDHGGSTGSSAHGGGGGGYGGTGGAGAYDATESASAGGVVFGSDTLPTIERGSGGGGGGANGGDGGDGGGALTLSAESIEIIGFISANGSPGTANNLFNAGGGGAGGGILLLGETVRIDEFAAIEALGGGGGDAITTNGDGGGGGGGGRIKVFYETSFDIHPDTYISVSGGPAGSGGSTTAAQAGSPGVYHYDVAEYTP